MRYFLPLLLFCFTWTACATDIQAAENKSVVVQDGEHVAIVPMKMAILPGTQSYLERSIEEAVKSNAALIVVQLDTPGGMLQTSQNMIQSIFSSPVPVVIYVSPSGGTATSAGVFITMAGHVAVMAPGTSIGAAHPVAGDGKDIEGDMRKKAEEITVAMVKSIAEERGRNVEWAEKAVKESASLTEKEALEKNVIDFISPSITDLLSQLKGRKVELQDGKEVELPDLSLLPRKEYEMSLRDEVINVLANPNVIALLWLAATTGISLELYNPGAIIPGMIGLIALLLALAVSQIIPISQGGVLLLILGAVLIGAEMFTGTFILGVGGVVSLIFGSLYLIDVTQAPGLSVSYELIASFAVVFGSLLLVVVYGAMKARKQHPLTGNEGLVGERAKTVEPVSKEGKIFLDGEYWNAMVPEGVIEKGAFVEVVAVHDGLVLEVKKIED